MGAWWRQHWIVVVTVSALAGCLSAIYQRAPVLASVLGTASLLALLAAVPALRGKPLFGRSVRSPRRIRTEALSVLPVIFFVSAGALAIDTKSNATRIAASLVALCCLGASIWCQIALAKVRDEESASGERF